MENEENEVSRNGHALKSGAIFGGVTVFLAYVIYAIDATIFGDWKYGVFLLIATLVVVCVFGRKYRSLIGGFMTFGSSFIYSYLFLVIAGLIGTISSAILYDVIDPDLKEIITEATIENTVSMMESFGAPESAIDEQVSELEKDLPERFSAVGVFTQFGWALLIYAVVSLITALIIQKKEPINDI